MQRNSKKVTQKRSRGHIDYHKIFSQNAYLCKILLQTMYIALCLAGYTQAQALKKLHDIVEDIDQDSVNRL